MPPTLKLGNFGLACGPMASRRSSSSSMAASSAIRRAISSRRSRSLSLGSRHGVAQTCRMAAAAAPKSCVHRRWVGRCLRAPARATRSQLSSKASASERSAVSLDPGGEQQQEGAFELGVGQELVAKRRPAALEGHRRADLVEHLDPRRQPGLDRVLGEQTLGERVERADGRAVELLQSDSGSAAPRSPSGSASAAFSSSARIRSRSSAPAFSVKVIAAIRRSSTWPPDTSAKTRWTRADVFPDPAPASTNSVVSRSLAIRSRADLIGQGRAGHGNLIRSSI